MGLHLLEVKSLVGHFIGWETNPDTAMDPSARIIERLNIGGVEVWITETVVNTWVFMAVLILFAVFLRVKMKNYRDKPSGFQNVVETAIE